MAYCARSDINQLYGSENVTAWATLSSSDASATIETRVTWACDLATEMVENILRGTPYRVPIVSPTTNLVPKTIIDLTARLAGLWLYEARGVDDMEYRDGQPVHRLIMHRVYADKILEGIRSGALVLDAIVGE